MTALENSVKENTSSVGKGNITSMPGSHRGTGSGRLSLRGQKRTLSSDISPAPELRASHRIRTNSSGDGDSHKGVRGSSKGANAALSGSGGIIGIPYSHRAVQLGLRRNPSSTLSYTTNSIHLSSGGESVGSPGLAGGRVAGVCPLANLGNTCFLNSVLYALRFLPGFTHDLHHLHTHLQAARGEGDESVQHRVQFLSELHSVFAQLAKEESNVTEGKRLPALQPYPFLQALRVVNPMFEGNRQQDAHELLHCLLDQLCHLPQDLVKRDAVVKNLSNNASLLSPRPSSPPHKKARRRSERIQALEEDNSKAVDVVGSKFVGRMCLETCCSECEKVTGREETFLEVCVPVKTKADFDDDEPPSECEVFMSALCEEECLQGNNKYWCDACSHHNEARRSVHYPQLPHHLLIHVKRFSSYSRNMYTSKCSDAMPAPLHLACFCRTCLETQLHQQINSSYHSIVNSSTEMNANNSGTKSKVSSSIRSSAGNKQAKDATTHLPYELSAMVCHLGASLSSGHYMTYVRVSPELSSACVDQHGCVGGDYAPAAPTADAAPPANGSHAGISAASVPADSSECLWGDCCALKLDQILPQFSATSLTNGYASDVEAKSSQHKSTNKGAFTEGRNKQLGKSNSKAIASNAASASGFWLECDDEKIKMVTAAEVLDRMKGTLITPYLLFYSRISINSC
ncbi:ubiquitin carboxyl-terminal hydrolase 1-like [Hyalella azteca]|uniref:Ubiquitin carboxyl-terminal hydrolase 1-like n=1 Tax=Hyalella azteca TaxID=294128 RepID=A0A8B7P0H9_HYAAZ|nr:ubiquitin carboxyl-terminal hydrolase 1-like [Hyalella azteca]